MGKSDEQRIAMTTPTPAPDAGRTPRTDAVDDKVSPDTNGHKDWKYAYFHLLVHARKLERELQAERERCEGLAARLNYATSLLAASALSEDYDADAALNEIERIKGDLAKLGKTSDWETVNKWYDELCQLCGVSNEDEINIFPLVKQRFAAIESIKKDRETLTDAIMRAETLIEQSASRAYEAAARAMNDLRDTVLNQRGALAENGMTNDQVNDVLSEIDERIEAIRQLAEKEMK